MLPALVAEEVIAAREPLHVAATRVSAEIGGLGGALLNVLVLVAMEVLGIEEALTADQAPMRALSALEVRLAVATWQG